MPTILDENQKPLRKAMDVLVFADGNVTMMNKINVEAQTRPSGGMYVDFDNANSKLYEPGIVPRLMELDVPHFDERLHYGFYNDGNAKPMLTGDAVLPKGQKYGLVPVVYWHFNKSFFINMHTVDGQPISDEYVYISYEYQNGVRFTDKVRVYATAYGGECTFKPRAVIIGKRTVYARPYITHITLDVAWEFNKSNLIDFQVQMRGANEKLDTGEFSLEGSEMSLTAYMGENVDNYIEVFSRMKRNSPITWASGYINDMSDIRTFYLTDSDYDTMTKCLKLKGCDATLSKLDGEYPGNYIESTYANVRQSYYNEIKRVLTSSGITPIESGEVPSGTGTTSSNYFLDKSTNRQLIAKSVNLFNDSTFQLMYRDAGIPELICGDVVTMHEISESDVADLTTNIEKSVNEYDITLYSSTKSATDVEVATVSEAVSGQTYWIDTTEPVCSVSTSGATLISPYRIKYIANTSGNVSIQGKFIKNSASVADTDKRIIKSGKKGIAVELDTLPRIDYDGGYSLTEHGIETMLDTANITYTFKWRGNPKMKPLDLIHMKRIGLDMLLPSEELYPRTNLYPKGGETTIMRITSISLEYKNGGLVSEITARRVGAL